MNSDVLAVTSSYIVSITLLDIKKGVIIVGKQRNISRQNSFAMVSRHNGIAMTGIKLRLDRVISSGLEMYTMVAASPNTWFYGASSGTGWPGVSIL